MNKPSVATVWPVLAALITATGTTLAAEGLSPPLGEAVWPQWQARVTLYSQVLLPVSLAGAADLSPRAALPSGSALGDYYFSAASLRGWPALVGLRATGGLVFGSRGLWGGPAATDLASEAVGTASYIGLGYSGLVARGTWGITADVGWLAEAATSRGGTALLGVQGQERSLRELRLSPLLQLGLHHSF
jgi:hypothetical protein